MSENGLYKTILGIVLSTLYPKFKCTLYIHVLTHDLDYVWCGHNLSYDKYIHCTALLHGRGNNPSSLNYRAIQSIHVLNLVIQNTMYLFLKAVSNSFHCWGIGFWKHPLEWTSSTIVFCWAALPAASSKGQLPPSSSLKRRKTTIQLLSNIDGQINIQWNWWHDRLHIWSHDYESLNTILSLIKVQCIMAMV